MTSKCEQKGNNLMPYCPKCDMEFVEGVTVCTDCGGPLVESKEAADRMKEEVMKKQEELLRKQYENLMAVNQAENELEETATRVEASKAYVNKKQQYEDVSSSASAFFIVGGILAAATILILTGILQLPMHSIMKYIFTGMLAIMAVGSFYVAVTSKKSAAVLKTEAEDEKEETEEIVNWFVKTYSADVLDSQILSDEPELTKEEMSLRRFDLIQDYLVTGRDLPDQSYIDALCDMIYDKLYKD